MVGKDSIWGFIIDKGIDAAGKLFMGGGGGGGDAALTQALRFQRYTAREKYISSVRTPKDPDKSVAVKMPKTETFMVYNKYWDGKLLDYYKQAQAVKAQTQLKLRG